MSLKPGFGSKTALFCCFVWALGGVGDGGEEGGGLALPLETWDLSSLIRDRAHSPCSASAKS